MVAFWHSLFSKQTNFIGPFFTSFLSLSYHGLNYLEDPHHNDFNEVEGDSEQLIQLRKELIDLVSYLILLIDIHYPNLN